MRTIKVASTSAISFADSLLSPRSDFQNTQGIIFVVDSNDRERVSEAREERESSVEARAKSALAPRVLG